MVFAFIYRSLILAFGYAYPAFLCFKTVEKNKIEIKELRFWCQYWIIVAILTIIEKFSDIFISWLPMYGEMKLAIVIYLWHPGTKGTGYVYETFLRPYLSSRERDIDRRIMELKERVFSAAINYWRNCSALGLNRIVLFIQMLISQSAKIVQPSPQKAENQQSNGAPAPMPPCTPSKTFRKMNSDKGRPPTRLPGTAAAAAHISQTLRSQSVKLHNQAQFIRNPDRDKTSELEEKSNSEHEFHAARIKLRPVKRN